MQVLLLKLAEVVRVNAIHVFHKRLIFQVLTANMNLSEDLDLEDYVSRPEKISGAEIACVVQEAGMQAVRNNRYVVLPKDFDKGYKANTQKNDKDFEFYR